MFLCNVSVCVCVFGNNNANYISHCMIILLSYIDTVGLPDAYKRKLDNAFKGKDITFVVEKKADANYAPCSAASVGEYMMFLAVLYMSII